MLTAVFGLITAVGVAIGVGIVYEVGVSIAVVIAGASREATTMADLNIDGILTRCLTENVMRRRCSRRSIRRSWAETPERDGLRVNEIGSESVIV